MALMSVNIREYMLRIVLFLLFIPMVFIFVRAENKAFKERETFFDRERLWRWTSFGIGCSEGAVFYPDVERDEKGYVKKKKITTTQVVAWCSNFVFDRGYDEEEFEMMYEVDFLFLLVYFPDQHPQKYPSGKNSSVGCICLEAIDLIYLDKEHPLKKEGGEFTSQDLKDVLVAYGIEDLKELTPEKLPSARVFRKKEWPSSLPLRKLSEYQEISEESIPELFRLDFDREIALWITELTIDSDGGDPDFFRLDFELLKDSNFFYPQESFRGTIENIVLD